MKEIRAIVRPARVEQLRDGLRDIPNFPGITMVKAKGFTAPAELGRRTVKEELTDYSDKIMVSVICDDAMVEPIRSAIFDACSTGQIGDGLVWVVDIDEIHRIRTRQHY